MPEVIERRDNTRAAFQTSIETRLLYQRLRTVKVGEIVSYTELSGLISQDVQQEGRGALKSARHIALRDDRIVLDAVVNVGIKRLSDRETVQSGAGTFTRMRRLASRGAQRMIAVDFGALPDEDKALHNASLSALAVVKLMAKPKSVDRLCANVSGVINGELPIARTLELFRGPKRA